ncbi:MAG: hypothetical protein QNJ18_09910 [Xenococcaceae cyanobacterium MO_167.B52]|nr:hypothetical protein [Xenococcaceae cyanobacterium MO_167.B52]
MLVLLNLIVFGANKKTQLPLVPMQRCLEEGLMAAADHPPTGGIAWGEN